MTDRDHEALAGGLPFLVAGTLPDGDRAALEAHLTGCADCRDRLARIRELADLVATDADGRALERAMEHVAPSLLVEYVEDRAALDAETVRWIQERLALCATCREAHENLLQAEEAIAAREARSREAGARDATDRRRDAVEDAGRPRGLWAWLASTVLQPVPALAYLLIAVVGLSLLWTGRSDRDAGEAAGVARVVALAGERALRDEPDGGPPAPRVVDAGDDPGAPVVVELVTELTAADLERMDFELAVERDGRTLRAERVAREAFALRDGKAVLPLALRPAALGLGVPLRIALRAVRPGDPVDGQELYVGRLEFRENGAPAGPAAE